MEQWLTTWSIRIAVFCLFVFLIGVGGRARNKSASTTLRTIWAIGSICSLLHMLFAMGFVHGWNHHSAFLDTADQTEDLLGIRVGIGIYFNYLFVAVWLLDAVWLVGWSNSYRSRNVWIGRLIFGYLVFIAVNGAIVFEDGWIRWVTVALVAVWIGKSNWVKRR